MLKITSLETFVHDKVCLVRVRTAEGAEGIGQAAPFNPDITAMVFHRHVVPLALGRSVDEPGSLTDAIWEASYKFHGTYLARALAGLDTALWDLKGKVTGKPVCALLGAQPRRLHAYASSMRRDTSPEAEVEALCEARDRYGFDAVKFKVGPRRGQTDAQAPQRTAQLIPLARQQLGDAMQLMVDANGSYTPDEAIAVGHHLEAHGYVHYEEPCPHDDLAGTAQVAAALEIAVAGGEQDYMLPQFRRMIDDRAVDVLQLDIGYVGGLSRALRVARWAAQAGLPCLPHSSNLSMIAVFTLHMLAAIPNAGLGVERSVHQPSATFYQPRLDVVDGHVAVPDGPGWGVTIDPGVLDAAVRVEATA